uniref:Uncharacterized protein n=1 Tax=Piliocolobus tephrosceles TaxID=591936 RepID=A0A8C9H8Z9_9PRIM
MKWEDGRPGEQQQEETLVMHRSSLSRLRKQLQPTHCKYEGPRKAGRLWSV